jgi:hypothetical protein
MPTIESEAVERDAAEKLSHAILQAVVDFANISKPYYETHAALAAKIRRFVDRIRAGV